MPEQLTKHPDVTLQVLRSAGARCGDGAPQKILTACPAERFCALPGGELCVYGLADAGRMTQVSPAEWRSVLGALPPAPPAPMPKASQESLFLGGGVLLAGLAAGAGLAAWRRRRGRHKGRRA